MPTSLPAGNTDVLITISTLIILESILNLYMPNFNEVYIRGDKYILSTKKRTRYGRINVSTNEEQNEIKP